MIRYLQLFFFLCCSSLSCSYVDYDKLLEDCETLVDDLKREHLSLRQFMDMLDGIAPDVDTMCLDTVCLAHGVDIKDFTHPYGGS